MLVAVRGVRRMAAPIRNERGPRPSAGAVNVIAGPRTAADYLYRMLALQVDTGAERLVTFHMVTTNVGATYLRLSRDY